MPSSDLMHRFLFDDTDIRGEVVTLADSYKRILENNVLPTPVQRLLGEFVAAASLLSSTLKFDGILTLHARGEGPVPTIMAECSNHKALRGIASIDENVDFSALADASLTDLLGKGVLAITIDPDQGERYQGLVPLESDNLAGCLEHYFAQSEQLATRFWLYSNDTTAAGLLLQMLPQQLASAEVNAEHWETSTHLASTVKAQELLELEHSEILYRLFNEEAVRLFEPTAARFECSCSRERSARTLMSLGRPDVENLLAEQEIISISCQFCSQTYAFAHHDLDELFGESGQQLH